MEEKLINLVQNYPELYDVSSKNYHDQQRRSNIWEEIAEEMGKSAADCKKRWINLRDSYRKALKSQVTRSGQAAQKKKPWRFEKQMSFLQSFTSDRQQISNVPDSDTDENEDVNEADESTQNLLSPDSIASTSYDTSEPTQQSVQSPSLEPKNTPRMTGKRNKKTSLSAAAVLQNYLQEKKHAKTNNTNSNSDQIAKFFDSIAATVRSFHPQLQIEVKSKILNIVNEAEKSNLEYEQSSSVSLHHRLPEQPPPPPPNVTYGHHQHFPQQHYPLYTQYPLPNDGM